MGEVDGDLESMWRKEDIKADCPTIGHLFQEVAGAGYQEEADAQGARGEGRGEDGCQHGF